MDRVKYIFKYLGPAFIVSVAYIDPGNFATNISGGSKFNYSLLWVLLLSNLTAMFLQLMSAKLGIATGHSIPEMCSLVYSKKLNLFFFVVAVIASMATNLAEFLGGITGLYLLFGTPPLYGCIIIFILNFIIVYIGKYGQCIVETVISILVAVICVSYTIELFLSRPDWWQAGVHMLMPSFPCGEAVIIAVGMLGATIMPHVIYLHSELVQFRNCKRGEDDKRKHLQMEKLDIIIAMNIAFIVNVAMVIVSAAVFFRNGMVVETIEQAHKSLLPLLGGLSSGAFGVALLASGLSSSAVGTMAGQTIMRGFIRIKISDNVTRLITVIPGILVIISGINPMDALIISQVILSFVLPVAIIPMMRIAGRKDLMGIFANGKLTNCIGWLITVTIVFMNALLIYFVFRGM